jgi:hypothetical protein
MHNVGHTLNSLKIIDLTYFLTKKISYLQFAMQAANKSRNKSNELQ